MTVMRRLAVVTVALVPILGGCGGSSKYVGRPNLEFIADGKLPSPTREDLTVPARPYAIGPADQLTIDVFGVPELSRTVTVDLAGQIALPLVGTLNVTGMGAEDLTRLIAQRLRTSVRNPQVTVNIATAANQVVTVDGAVTSPGVYPVLGRMSLIRAIARAQGTTEFSKENHVVVFRRSGGREYATLYDLRAIRQGAYADPEIYSNDVIVVGESQARRLFKDVLAASTLLTAPIIALVPR